MNREKLMCEQRFIDHIYEGYKASQRYCFILGAGASKTSGIRTGEEFMKEWMAYFKDRGIKYMKECAEELNLSPSEYEKFFSDSYELKNDDYFTLFDLRFAGQSNAAFAFLENEMANKYPSYGYYPLSMLLSNTQNKLVITTNFDSLVEDALFTYKLQHPLVVGHESLASYITNDARRPVVAKIHRDLLFRPMNQKKDMNQLKDEWRLPLTAALTKYIPIVIGYAGGDKTLMSLLEEIKLQGIYWCYINKIPSNTIRKIVSDNNGYLVQIQGFDEILFLLGERFHSEANFNDPCQYIREQAEIRCQLYQKNFERIANKYRIGQNTILHNIPKDTLMNIQKAFEQYNTRQAFSIKNTISLQETAENLLLNNKYNDALDICNDLIDSHPTTANYYYIRSNIFYQSNKLQKALEDASQAIKLNINEPKFYLLRGEIQHSLKNFDDALTDKTIAISLNPNEPDYYFSRNATAFELRDLNMALKDASKAIELDPENPIYYDCRSITYYELDDLNAALDDASKAIKLNPENPNFYYSRSAVYHKLGRLKEALEDSKKAHELKDKTNVN